MRKNNFQIVHVAPIKLKKPVFWVLLIGAIFCTVAALLCLLGKAWWFVLGYISIMLWCICLALWPLFIYYGIYLPKFSISLNLTQKELTLVTPRKTVTVPINEASYTVTTFGIREPVYFLHLFYQGKKIIRLRTDHWSNIKFLLDLPHKPDPKVRKLK